MRRDIGCYLGLRPRRSPSGDQDPQLGITKADNDPRSLLIACASSVGADNPAHYLSYREFKKVHSCGAPVVEFSGCLNGVALLSL